MPEGCRYGRRDRHLLAQSVAYGDLGNRNPALVTSAYRRNVDPVIELPLETTGVRLAYVLDKAFQ
jgi:hypothetical protein